MSVKTGEIFLIGHFLPRSGKLPDRSPNIPVSKNDRQAFGSTVSTYLKKSNISEDGASGLAMAVRTSTVRPATDEIIQILNGEVPLNRAVVKAIIMVLKIPLETLPESLQRVLTPPNTQAPPACDSNRSSRPSDTIELSPDAVKLREEEERKEINEAVRNALRELFKTTGMEKEKFANECGVSRDAIYKFMNGQRELTPKSFDKITDGIRRYNPALLKALKNREIPPTRRRGGGGQASSGRAKPDNSLHPGNRK